MPACNGWDRPTSDWFAIVVSLSRLNLAPRSPERGIHSSPTGRMPREGSSCASIVGLKTI